MAHPQIDALTSEGQSVWQDDIARSMLISGKLADTIENVGIRGLTSNPTIFEKAIASGTDYDDQIAESFRNGKTAAETFEALEISDLKAACDLFRPLYDATNAGDGYCSIEVFPNAARDADSTREQARRLWATVARPNLLVKIPGTVEGAPVIAEMISEGININITLLFSLEAYERVAWAYIEGLERRFANGLPINHVASVASFFVSRVDTLVDRLLDEQFAASSERSDLLQSLKGKIAVANAKLAYAKFQEIFGGERFQKLARAGAHRQRPLWASTGTKNPAYPDTLYVDTLIGPETVNTMPGKTMEAFMDHGVVARTVDQDVEAAERDLRDLARAGIDINAVTAQLENEGIDSFTKSFETLLAGVEGKRTALAGVS